MLSIATLVLRRQILWLGCLVVCILSSGSNADAQAPRTLADLLDEDTETRNSGASALDKKTGSPTHPEGTRRPIPSAAKAAAATKTVRDIFGNDFAQATTPESQITLAKNLVVEAGRATKDAEQWALLSEALRLTMDAGSLEETDRIIQKMAVAFTIDMSHYRLESISQMAAKATPANADSIALACIKESRVAAAHGRRDDATKLLSTGQRLAQRTRNQSLTAQFQALAAEYRTSEKNERELAGLLEKYRTSSGNPQAALALGKHYCFVLEDWNRGLPILTKGSDADLASLARQEAVAQDNPQGLVAAADGWVSWGCRQKGGVKAAGLTHAAELYAQAMASLQGLDRTRVEKKLQELAVSESASGQKVWLTDSTPARVAGVAFGLGTDGKYEGKPIWCGGEPCLNSIRAMPGGGMKPATAVYPIPAGAKRVTGSAAVFVPDSLKNVAHFRPPKPQFFELKIDGRSVWKSPPLAKPNDKIAFDVVVAGGAELELVTMSESGSSAFCVWLKPAWVK